MASNRNPGPVCQYLEPVVVADGTMCRAASPLPGTVCVSQPQGLAEKARRALNIKDAFLLGIRNYAYKETVAKLGADLQLLIDSLWPGIVQALEIYGISIGAGAVLGGIVGAFAGGVGAAPGAILGAELGAEVASLILLALGIKFLAEYCLQHLDQTNQHLQRGLKLAWEACGDHPSLDPAAREFGRAIAELVSLILEAAAAWVLKKGLDAGLRDLNKSKVGRALAPYAKVRYWIDRLGVTDAPVPRKGIATTIEFFEEQTRLSKLSPMEEGKLLSYWKAMDFSRKVTKVVLEPGKELVGYRDPKSPYGFYYTTPGTYIDRVGIDYVTQRSLPPGEAGPVQLVERQFIRYRVKTAVQALESTSSGVRAWDTNRPVPGGGTQYFIPRSWEVLEIIE